MCGIAGLLDWPGAGVDDMERMLDVLRHRGPDDAGLHRDHGFIMGQRRLSIIDLEGGHQPIPNEDRRLWIVCHGQIYNYRSLRRELEAAGHRFRTDSDSEVILHLYEDKGRACVDCLRGMFAFAIWDGRTRRLFCARDRLGQKPFYYVNRGGALAFASEIKALLALDSSLRRMDHAALDQYLTLRLIAPPRSMFQEIRKLPPAHWLEMSEAGVVKTERYWTLRYEPKHSASEDELVDELEARLIDCIRLHMVSDVPVGAFLSGGLDSTLVAAMLMKHCADGPIQTFTMGLPYGDYDEAPYARLVAERYGTQHHEETIMPSLADTLPALVWHLDEPSDPLSVCSYLISEMASRHVKVVLGGDGGDELFGGYDRYYGNVYAGYYARLPATIRKHVIGALLRRLPDGGWYKSKAHQIKWLHRLSFLEGGQRYARSLSYFYFGGRRRNGLYGPAMADALAHNDPEQSIVAAFDAADAASPIDRMLHADSCIRLPDHPVMILDRMTMAHSLEARSPLMDHEIAEFSARLPVDLKVRGRSLRYIQYRLAERYLPEAVLKRPKQGFSSALPYMLHDEFELLYDVFLRDSSLAREGILNQSSIDELLLQRRRGVDHGNRLWLLLNSQAWYAMQIQGQSVQEMQDWIMEARRSPGGRGH